jgi:hypothetical protein
LDSENDKTNDTDSDIDDTGGTGDNVVNTGETNKSQLIPEVGADAQNEVNLDQVRNLIEKELKSKTLITAEVMQQFAQVAGKVFIQLQNENKKKPENASNEKYWKEYDESIVCLPCALFHKNEKVPAGMKRSIKGFYGVIKKGPNLKKHHLTRSKKEHCEIELHDWCVEQYDNQKEEKLTYEESNAKAAKIVITNALLCFQRSYGARDFAAFNSKEQLLHPETAATKNDSEKEFFRLRNVVFDILSEKTRKFFKEKIKNIAVTLDKGAKYLVFVSSCSVKTRELSFAQFVYFLRKVCLFFNF